jgi:carboxypeptidase C (cathepsin A)
LNWYDLYRENYNINDTHDFWGNPLENPRYGKSVLENGEEYSYKRGHSFYDYVGKWNKHHPEIWAQDKGMKKADNLMIGEAIADYFNKKSLKALLHINDSKYLNNNSSWESCNGNINSQWHIQNEASLWIYRVFYHQSDIKMLFFSGDTDGAVPTLGTRKWIEKLNWEVKKPWTPWVHEGEVQGYIEHYRGHFDFATVKGVGHMAP